MSCGDRETHWQRRKYNWSTGRCSRDWICGEKDRLSENKRSLNGLLEVFWNHRRVYIVDSFTTNHCISKVSTTANSSTNGEWRPCGLPWQRTQSPVQNPSHITDTHLLSKSVEHMQHWEKKGSEDLLGIRYSLQDWPLVERSDIH